MTFNKPSLSVLRWASWLGMVGGLIPFSACAQYVASDACGYTPGNAYTVDASCVPRAFAKPADFTATFDPGTCGSGPFDDAYGWFTGTGVDITLNYAPNSTEDPIVHILTGNCGSLTTVTCANDLGTGGSETITMPTVNGQTYLIRIQAAGSDNAMADGQICIYPTPPPPPNDEPCTATFLSTTTNCTNVVTSSNTSATPTAGIPDPGCYYGAQADIWYTTLVPSTGSIMIDTYVPSGTGPGDSGMAIYSSEACDEPMTLITCNDDQTSTDHMPAIQWSGLTPGDTVYIRFWAYYTDDGSFLICASPDNSTLPVELTAFNAVPVGRTIQLDWSTASEKNSDHFTVERGNDGLTFAPIGNVIAAGTSQAPLHYAFLDAFPEGGVNYYRLKQVDKDGTSTLSDVVVAESGQQASVLLFPNPVKDMLTIRSANDLPPGATIRVTGALDRTSIRLPVGSTGASHRDIQVDTHDLLPGPYSIQMVTSSEVHTWLGIFMKL